MDERGALAEPFEQNRSHLRAVAYRMLGSLSEAEDAVQEAWLRLSRADTSEVANLKAWLTTVVARVCLDMLRSRRARREQVLDPHAPDPAADREHAGDPETEAAMADSVGLALLVVLETLAPAERLAFVLHEMFGMPFDQIANIVGRSPAATRQLASRARRRVQGAPTVAEQDLGRQRAVVDAYLAALRAGDFDALLALLDPEVVFRADADAVRIGAAPELRGAQACAKQALASSRGAKFARPALVDGRVGLIVAPRGQLAIALNFTIRDGKIAELELVSNPGRVAKLELAVLND